MPILAKSNGVTLKKHVEDVLQSLEPLPADPDLKAFIRKVVLYHDLGKVISAFQRKVGGNSEEDGIPDVPHSFLSIAFVPENVLKEMGEGQSKIFLSCILYHHWRETYFDYLFGSKRGSLQKAYERLLEVGDKLADRLKEEMGNLCAIEINRPLCEYLSRNCIFDSGLVIPPHLMSLLPSFILRELSLKDERYKHYVLSSGMVMRADRFASYVETTGDRDLLKKSDIPFSRDSCEVVGGELKRKYSSVWQRNLVKDVRGENMVLIAPTGAGKTEFALMWSEGKTIFTLPLRSATNMVYERVKQYFGNENVGLLHSDAAFHLFFSSKAEQNRGDIEGEVLQIVEQSRFLSYPFIVATGDQIFPSTLKYPSYEMVYSVLARSYLIVDEIQAYSPEAAAIIVKTVEDVKELGGNFLLMTATLPGFIKDEIIKRTGLDERYVKDVYEEIPQGERCRNVLKFEASSDPTEKALAFFEQGQKVLIIRNTVKSARKTYEYLRTKTDAVLLVHSQMTLEDRKDIEKVLENYRPEAGGRSIILVATQVVEASMDIDFDVLLTDVAPSDSLVQRMGRIYRKREWLEKSPNTFVYVGKDTKEFSTLFSGVYNKDVIMKTLEAIGDISSNREFSKEKDLLDHLVNISSLHLTEAEKKEWVEKTYQKLKDEDRQYIRTFYETLDTLDSGYSSEKKQDAHRIFRKIASISIVPENRKEEFLKEFQNIDNYFEFRQVAAEHLVNIPCFSIKEHQLEPLEVSGNNRKISRWINCLYVLKDSKYEKGVGIIFLKG